ncbi:DNA-methyltransferase [Streptomyces albus]|uniref:DNA-methyltransferase n=1 Tax=Streptomyces albus TaxID=1888 RepID=UPI00099ECA21|nr:site-specific DNA-methyltransferase [Streptomyces albus]
MSLAPETHHAKPVISRNLSAVGVSALEDWEPDLSPATTEVVAGDARDTGLPNDSVDLIVTSPPYWRKRDYGHQDQIGQEPTPQAYVESMMKCLDEWKRVLRPSGSVFLNVGDTYHNRSLMGIPGLLEFASVQRGWLIRNRIIWTKDGGMPEPAKNRLANRHEYIIHLALKPNYYYDLFGYSEYMGNGANPGDVWKINPERNMGSHLAPYPQELVRRSIMLGCPPQVCSTCNKPRTRVFERTRELDPNRSQARRAMELANAAGLTDDHIRAIQATGVSDVGKATKFQSGTGRNSPEVQRLAAEAKAALGGYFREFTFAKKVTTGWTDCGHGTPARGMVLDPFMGTGTTLKTAQEMGRDAVGVDLVPLMQEPGVPAKSKIPAKRSGR